MSERENLQPENELEPQESSKATESQALTEATHEPGARIEQTQEFAQAEVVEGALVAALASVEPGGAAPEVLGTAPAAEISKTEPPDADDTRETATPINVPGPQPGQGVAATPINLPNPVGECPDPGSSPPAPNMSLESGREAGDADLVAAEDRRVDPTPSRSETAIPQESVVLTESALEEGHTLSRKGEVPEPGGTPPGPNRVGVEIDGVDAGQAALSAHLGESPEPGPDPFPRVADDGSELMQPVQFPPLEQPVELATPIEDAESLPETEPAESAEGGEADQYYFHEDADGKITVVDENGKPVDSPPNVIYFNGKYYAMYAGDDVPIKEDGTVTDPQKLAKYEINAYQGDSQGMYLHEDADGKITVVDENGVPVDSPPAVVTYQGKKYLVYPGENPINPDGTVKDPSKLIAAENYTTSTAGMYLHEDADGKVTVVDENGVPVDSPPAVVMYQGKKYLVYPGENPINSDGTVKDPEKLVAAEYYQASTVGMYLYEDTDGKVTVVDENGVPVNSPPTIITYQGKQYAVYPGENPIAADGTVKNPQNLIELATYQSQTQDVYLHEGPDGKITVVDANGDPVASPPHVIEYQGKYYLTKDGKSPVDPDGKLAAPDNLIEVQNYKADIAKMYLHEGQNGRLTVVDVSGKAVSSPPQVFQYQGKYYAAYPGDEPFGPDGSLKDPSKLVEIKNYKPAWWQQKTS